METLFQTLGLPSKLNINPKELNDRFRDLSLQFHPDRTQTSAPESRAAAIKKSSQINLAYRTLSDPWARATYAVELLSNSKTSETNPDHLEQLMEIQELTMELQEAKFEDDTEKTEKLSESLKIIQAKLNERFRSLETIRDSLFKRFDDGDNQAISDLNDLLGERKYLLRVLQNISTALS